MRATLLSLSLLKRARRVCREASLDIRTAFYMLLVGIVELGRGTGAVVLRE